uniref:Uncharacterized protein n=1 Tax=Strigamia maritima TaxID=126957 RepID=T1JHT6_STRMM
MGDGTHKGHSSHRVRHHNPAHCFQKMEKSKTELSSLQWMSYSILLAFIVACCYHNALPSGLVFDDISAIRDNRDLRPHTPLINLFKNDFWGTPINKGSCTCITDASNVKFPSSSEYKFDMLARTLLPCTCAVCKCTKQIRVSLNQNPNSFRSVHHKFHYIKPKLVETLFPNLQS